MSYLNSTKPKILMLIGTRPEAIKMAPVYLALRNTGNFDLKLVSTGQHKELLWEALKAFDLQPDLDLEMMQPGQSLGQLVGRSLTALDQLLAQEAPDHVLVHGDTATGFAGALACFYRRVPCAHVEAGLRTYRLDSPFPEEFHRQVVAKAASLHFAPTEEAAENLRQDGVKEDQIVVTGSTSVDAVVHAMGGETPSQQKLVLITAHRRENGGRGLNNIMTSVRTLCRLYPEYKFVLPVHPNPAVGEAVKKLLPAPQNLRLVSPLDYQEFVRLMARSSLILTDSGGIQEEAAFLGKQVLLLRDTTERPEALSCGSARLVGTESFEIIRQAKVILNGGEGLSVNNPFGNPGVSRRIAAYLTLHLTQEESLEELAA